MYTYIYVILFSEVYNQKTLTSFCYFQGLFLMKPPEVSLIFFLLNVSAAASTHIHMYTLIDSPHT